MLDFTVVNHPDQIKKYFFENNQFVNSGLQKITLIVSDLKSKQEVQKIYLEKFGFYTDESILRISDFWKIWLRRLSPKINIVSSEFMQALVSEYLEKFGQELDLQIFESQTLYRYIYDLAPLILHQQSHENLKEWLWQKVQSDNKPHWLKWEILAQNCLNYIITTHHCIENHWTVSYLQTLKVDKIIWPHKLVVDLGSQMSSLELGLLNTISQKNKIEVIVPKPQWKDKFNYILKTYADQSGYMKMNSEMQSQISQLEVSYQKLLGSQFLRFSTEVNEIKFVTAKVRAWIDQGVSPENISIISPRIESYWSILKFHFDQEGVTANKDTVSSLISLGIIGRWLSYINLQTQSVNWSKLEMAYGYLIHAKSLSSPEVQNFEKFKSLYSELLGSEDLNRSKDLHQLFFEKIDLKEKLNRDQFLMLMLKSWVEIDSTLNHKKLFQSITKDFIQKTTDANLKFSLWISLLSERLSKKEVKTEPAVSNGVQVISINSAHIMQSTHRLWIGLDESGLKGRQDTLLPINDIVELKNIFDLALDYPEESHADFNLRWYSMSEAIEQYFTCAHVSATAEPLNASLFFLENIKEPKMISPEITVFDSDLAVFDPKLSLKLTDLQKTKFNLEYDALDLNIQNLKIKNLSPSDLETYSQCSYKFLARKGYNLLSLDPLGLEIEPRQKGNLIHDLFKFLVDDKKYLQADKMLISNHLEVLRKEKNLFPEMNFLWQPQKEKFILAALNFCEIEKNRLQYLIHLKHKTEQSVQFYYDLSTFQFTSEQPQDHFLTVKGRFDRLDFLEDQNVGVLIDYKSSKNDSLHFASEWIENSEFQLLLYSLAVEKIFNISIVGALYYFYKNFKHNYGYLLPTENPMLECFSYTKATLLNNEDKANVLSEFSEKIQDIFQNILQNKFYVKPIDPKICDHCEWINVCRIKNQH